MPSKETIEKNMSELTYQMSLISKLRSTLSGKYKREATNEIKKYIKPLYSKLILQQYAYGRFAPRSEEQLIKAVTDYLSNGDTLKSSELDSITVDALLSRADRKL